MRKLFDRNETGPAGWVWKLIFGPGAGYIGGRTAFVAWRSGSLRWTQLHRPDAVERCRSGYFRIGCLEFGLTTNANLVPYTTH